MYRRAEKDTAWCRDKHGIMGPFGAVGLRENIPRHVASQLQVPVSAYKPETRRLFELWNEKVNRLRNGLEPVRLTQKEFIAVIKAIEEVGKELPSCTDQVIPAELESKVWQTFQSAVEASILRKANLVDAG